MTGDPVQGEDGDGGHGDDHGKEHDCDEPGGSVGCFRGRLGDSKGINEDICEIK